MIASRAETTHSLLNELAGRFGGLRNDESGEASFALQADVKTPRRIERFRFTEIECHHIVTDCGRGNPYLQWMGPVSPHGSATPFRDR